MYVDGRVLLSTGASIHQSSATQSNALVAWTTTPAWLSLISGAVLPSYVKYTAPLRQSQGSRSMQASSCYQFLFRSTQCGFNTICVPKPPYAPCHSYISDTSCARLEVHPGPETGCDSISRTHSSSVLALRARPRVLTGSYFRVRHLAVCDLSTAHPFDSGT
jgi:hypothetical protein